MAYSYNEVLATGAVQLISVPEYIDQAHVKVSVNGVDTTSFTWANASTVSGTFTPVGAKVRVRRESSPSARVVDYLDGVPVTEIVLDNDSKQAFFLAQEQLDATEEAIDAIGSLPAALASMTASEAAAAASASAAATSASNAATERTAADAAKVAAQASQTAAEAAKVAAEAARDTASGHASTASTQASNASTSASNASSSASAAATSATNAATSASAAAASAAAAAFGKVQDFRLTLTSGTPVTTANVSGGTIYACPYKGNQMALYASGSWAVYASAQFSLALSGLTVGRPYDVFAFISGGVPTLEALAWSGDTVRATGLAYQDGVLVKSGDPTRRYMGTFCATGVATTEDSTSNRYLWNYYHRASRPMKAQESANTWTYTTGVYRQANNNSGNQLNFVIGVLEDDVFAEATHSAKNSSTGVTITTAIGLDSTTARAADCISQLGATLLANNESTLFASYRGYPGIGKHFLAWLEYSGASGTTTWIGDNATTTFQSGIVGSVMG